MKDKDKQIILWFKDLSIKDVSLVGGKTAALGEMYNALTKSGIKVPNGFALTATAYNLFLETNDLKAKIAKELKGLNIKNIKSLQKTGRNIRNLILNAAMPKEIEEAMFEAYARLGNRPRVAVRSSATAEDLPGASFAGQQETYLNIYGANNAIDSAKKCFASLFTDRAISYREDKGFKHAEVSLSVAVQIMVRSHIGSSGVAFTIDPETGFAKVIVINSAFGIGEDIVQGRIIPDEFVVFKANLKLISKQLGEARKFSLADKEAEALAGWCYKIEEHFNRPMDIEWAKDGKTGELFILQARPETIHAGKPLRQYEEYRLLGEGKEIIRGAAVGTKISSGKVKIILKAKDIDKFAPGEILVTGTTDPDWEPIMKIASAIVTDQGGRTSHAAIVSRELGIPCVVGTSQATQILKNGEEITVDCSDGKNGKIYEGRKDFKIIKHRLDHIAKTKTKIMLNIGSPEEAWRYSFLPIQGIGLGRLEFIISSYIRIHPNALINYQKLNKSLKNKIDKLTLEYKDKREFYINELAEGIAKIAATVWPYPAIIRFSDFKTNEYETLLGGDLYEPREENPMLGWRGASRYYHPKFQAAFEMECEAMRRAGLKNIIPMVPFCRTPEEGERVKKIIRAYLKTGPIYVMAEIPANILLADEFLDIFDGMSIGSNDLAQLVLGLDRDNAGISQVANENNPAVKKMIADLIKICQKKGKYIGICGQAPSDYPEFVKFLIKEGIESISLAPDSVLKTLETINKIEK